MVFFSFCGLVLVTLPMYNQSLIDGCLAWCVCVCVWFVPAREKCLGCDTKTFTIHYTTRLMAVNVVNYPSETKPSSSK